VIAQNGEWTSYDGKGAPKTGPGLLTLDDHLNDKLKAQKLSQAVTKVAEDAQKIGNNTGAAAQIAKLGFTGPHKLGTDGSMVYYTKGSQQYTIALTPGAGLEWEYFNSATKAKADGKGTQSLEDHLTNL